MLTKEECMEALNELFVYSKHIANKVEISSLTECYGILEQLINEHFESRIESTLSRDNPPLKFEELKEGMWVWDNKYKDYIKFKRNDRGNFGKLLIFSKGGDEEFVRFIRENRFYRMQLEE